jgi:hypothetical protein
MSENPARLMAGTVLLMSQSADSIAAADNTTGGAVRSLKVLGKSAALKLATGDMHVAEARVVVNSSGAGNVRTDIEPVIRKKTGAALGTKNEVIVALIPGQRVQAVSDEQAEAIERGAAELAERVIFGEGKVAKTVPGME